MKEKLFLLGQILFTAQAWKTIEACNISPMELIDRHVSGDCSDMTKIDQQDKQEAIKNGSRVVSYYKLAPDNTEIWILTASSNEETKTSVFLLEEA